MAGASAIARVRNPLGALLTEELAPRPGRLAAALRTAACCCLVTAVTMVFRIPAADLAVFLVFVFSGEDVVASAVAGLCIVFIRPAMTLSLIHI